MKNPFLSYEQRRNTLENESQKMLKKYKHVNKEQDGKNENDTLIIWFLQVFIRT